MEQLADLERNLEEEESAATRRILKDLAEAPPSPRANSAIEPDEETVGDLDEVQDLLSGPFAEKFGSPLDKRLRTIGWLVWTQHPHAKYLEWEYRWFLHDCATTK